MHFIFILSILIIVLKSALWTQGSVVQGYFQSGDQTVAGLASLIHCKQKISSRTKVNITAKVIHTDDSETSWSQTIGTVIDLKKATTLKLKCSATYPIELSVIDGSGKEMITTKAENASEIESDPKEFLEMADFILPLGGGKFLAKCTPMKCKSADSLAVLGVKYTADLLHVFPLDLPAIRKISQTDDHWQTIFWIPTGIIFGALIFLACGCFIIHFCWDSSNDEVIRAPDPILTSAGNFRVGSAEAERPLETSHRPAVEYDQSVGVRFLDIDV